MQVVVLRLAAWTVIWAGAGCRANDVTCASDASPKASTARPLVGAIRFYVWQPGQFSNSSVQLGPRQWRYRLPFYGVQIDSATVFLNESTQAVMDQEIAYAHAAGLDFFCFNHFTTGDMRANLSLYLSSAHKGDINFCLQMGGLPAPRVADAITLMKEPTYQKVLGGRPLVFFETWYFNQYTPPMQKAEVDAFRAQVMGAGLPNPYIVVENHNASSAAADADKYGADAISAYAMGIRGDPGASQPRTADCPRF